MKKFILQNGLTLIYERKATDTVTIEATFNVGSNNETSKIAGISHFVEHMLFEGTSKRPNNQMIANEIERLGGDLNAYTTNERTSYYIKVPKKHFNIALEILSDIIQNPTFQEWAIKKERNIILKEINMVTDQPRFHQWIVFYDALFKKHAAKNPTYGTRKAVKSITRMDLLGYYRKYYSPNNMVISVIGNVDNPYTKVESAFMQFYKKPLTKLKEVIEPPNKKNVKIQKKKILNSYMVLGYKTPSRLHNDSYVLDVINAILARGQSGRIVEEVRTKRGLAYEVNVHHEAAIDYGIFAVHLSTDKKNLGMAERIILEQFKGLSKLTKKDIDDAKGYLEGKKILDNEDTHNLADELNFWELVKDANLQKRYLKDIQNITKYDIIRVARDYLNEDYTKIILMQND